MMKKILFEYDEYNLLNCGMLKNKIFWFALILLMFVPMIITFAFAENFIAILQNDLYSWNYQPGIFILSDILFYEAGFFLFFGAILAGVILFLDWKTDRLSLYVEPVFSWKLVKKEREIPRALLFGLLLIGIGIFCISVSIIITL